MSGHEEAEFAAARPGPRQRRGRDRVALVLVGLTLAVVAWQALTTVGRLRLFERRHDEQAALAENVTARIVAESGAYAPGIETARRSVLADGRRFSIVFGPDVSASDRRTIRLVAGATFLPATGTGDPETAATLVAVGRVPESARDGFDVVARDGDVWVGTRAP